MFTQDEKCLAWARKVVLRRSRSAAKSSMQAVSPCVFDIGHNTGEFTKTAIMAFGIGTTVHAFEPNPDVEFLYEKAPNVKISRVAVASSPGSLTLYVPTFHNETKSSSHLASLANRPCFSSFDHSYIKTVPVPVTTVDDYCMENSVTYIDYLKIDTEGYELDVFQGARNMLGNKRVACGQFEIGSTFTERGYTVEEVVRLLHELDYGCFLGELISDNQLMPETVLGTIAQKSVDGWENILFVDNSLLVT